MGNLSDLKAKAAKPGKHTDGDGLYLLVTQAGGKYWRYDYRVNAKRKTLALGVYPDVSLAQARQRLMEARSLLADGQDPSLAKRRTKARRLAASEATFAVVAGLWQQKTAAQRKANTEEKLSNWLRHDILPSIGPIPVADLSATDVRACLRKMEARGLSDSVRRVKQIISRVMDFAIADGLATANPCASIKNADQFKLTKTVSHAAITEPAAFGGLLRAIEGHEGHFTVGNALRLAPLVFVRPGELRLAQWTEFSLDGENPVWEIPAERMKMKAAHTVPLSRQAVEILRQQQRLGSEGFVFASIRGGGRPISENTLNASLRTLGYDNKTHVAHGFRASARTLMAERLGERIDLIEMQLAHAVRDANGRAYNRTQFLSERAAMMQRWADYCDNLRQGGQVLSLPRKAA